MGVAKVANNWNDLVKGSLTRQKLQNSKGYTKAKQIKLIVSQAFFLGKPMRDAAFFFLLQTTTTIS